MNIPIAVRREYKYIRSNFPEEFKQVQQKSSFYSHSTNLIYRCIIAEHTNPRYNLYIQW